MTGLRRLDRIRHEGRRDGRNVAWSAMWLGVWFDISGHYSFSEGLVAVRRHLAGESIIPELDEPHNDQAITFWGHYRRLTSAPTT